MRRFMELSGEWLFSFQKNEYNDTIMLPSTTAMSCKGTINEEFSDGFLTEKYPYEGTAFFARSINIPEGLMGKRFVLYLERTRITQVTVNKNAAGECNYLTVPHRYDITELVRPGDNLIEIAVSNTGYPTAGGHMTSPDTQSNWLGIMGRMELQIYDRTYIENVRTTSDHDTVFLDCTIVSECEGYFDINIDPCFCHIDGLVNGCGLNFDISPEGLPILNDSLPSESRSIRLKNGVNHVRLSYDFGSMVKPWSEYAPGMLKIMLSLSSENSFDTYEVTAGVKSFKADTHDFFLNGNPVKLRGKHDALLFPMTGAAPMDVHSYLRVMGIARNYGINHYRYHTCCPPDAAFEAADLLGIIMEPELPFWGTINAPDEEGYNEKEQNYLIEEGKRILTEYGNHPSFCMMSLGNELWGSRERINEIIGFLKKHDDRPLYTGGSNNFQFVPKLLPNEDFFVGARLAAPKNGVNNRLIRGSFATCDAPLGFVQTDEPANDYNFDKAVIPAENKGSAPATGGKIAIQYGTGVRIVDADSETDGVTASVPIISHETGQYYMYPDLKTISKYTGPLMAGNFQIFKNRLDAAGLSYMADAYARDSGMFAVSCYREELEAMHRSRFIAGYQLLDIQDYTGQGTATVGILDSFMDSKGLIMPEKWRTFCSDQVLSASFHSCVYVEEESFSAQIILSKFNPLLSVDKKELKWSFSHSGKILVHGGFSVKNDVLGTEEIGEISFIIPKIPDNCYSAKMTLSLEIGGTGIRNSYDLWIYSDIKELPDAPIDFATPDDFIPGFYCADFWNYHMFRQISENVGKPVPIGTLGLTILKDHPALGGFACETYSTPQWYRLVSACRLEILDDRLPKDCRPIVQMIDNTDRNHKLGIIYENPRTGRLTCTISENVLKGCPQGRALYKSLADYLMS